MRISSRKELQENFMQDYGQMGMMIAHLTESTKFLNEECDRLENKLQSKDKELEKLNNNLKTTESKLNSERNAVIDMKYCIGESLIGRELKDGDCIFIVDGYDLDKLKLSKVSGDDSTTEISYDVYSECYALTYDRYMKYLQAKEKANETNS